MIAPDSERVVSPHYMLIAQLSFSGSQPIDRAEIALAQHSGPELDPKSTLAILEAESLLRIRKNKVELTSEGKGIARIMAEYNGAQVDPTQPWFDSKKTPTLQGKNGHHFGMMGHLPTLHLRHSRPH